MIILPALFLATPEVSVSPVGCVGSWLGSVGGGCAMAYGYCAGADGCCCQCRWLLLPALLVIPGSIWRVRIGSHVTTYRMSRGHVSIGTCSRIKRYEPANVISSTPKPLPSPPQGAGVSTCCVLGCLSGAPSPWGRLGWGSYVGWYAPPATLTELRLHSPGLRAWPATLGNAPTNIATL